MNYLFFDIETNGLPADYNAPITDSTNWPHMLQLAWVLTDGEGNKIESRCDYIKLPDGVDLDAKAAKTHGITLEQSQSGLAVSYACMIFMSAVARAGTCVAHNLDFDISIILSTLMRINWSDDADWLALTPAICTMQSSVDFCAIPGPYGNKWPKLAELHQKLFNEGFDGAHDAMNDVQATMRCFFALKERGVITVSAEVRA